MSIRTLDFKPTYDVTVIGAGVFGACLAFEANRRGLSVLLVDQHDYGSGTSANSLKTIHGGLRYLQQLDVLSSRTSIIARREWLQLAPDLVTPLPCLLPTSRQLMKSRPIVGAGLLLYQLLSLGCNKGIPRKSQIPPVALLNKATTQQRLNGFDLTGITGAAHWHDAQMQDSEQLVYAFVASAQRNGADCHNYVSVDGITPAPSHHSLTLVDQLTQQSYEVTSKTVVDCSGVGRVLENQLRPQKPSSSNASTSAYASAVNLVLNRKLCDYAVGITVKTQKQGNRALFLSPWRNSTLLGTWYFENPEPTSSQLNTCLTEINQLFPEAPLKASDISHIHVGHLPVDAAKMTEQGAEHALIKQSQIIDWEKATDLSKASQDYQGLFSLKGTKYTLGYVAAKQMVQQLKRYCPLSPAPRLTRITLDIPTDASIKSQIEQAVVQQQAWHLDDVLLRRLPIGDEKKPSDETIATCLAIMAAHFDWDTERQAQEKDRLNQQYRYLQRLNENMGTT